MATQGYEAVFVLKQTKKDLKVMCAQEEKTFDEMVETLIQFYKEHHATT